MNNKKIEINTENMDQIRALLTVGAQPYLDRLKSFTDDVAAARAVCNKDTSFDADQEFSDDHFEQWNKAKSKLNFAESRLAAFKVKYTDANAYCRDSAEFKKIAQSVDRACMEKLLQLQTEVPALAEELTNLKQQYYSLLEKAEELGADSNIAITLGMEARQHLAPGERLVVVQPPPFQPLFEAAHLTENDLGIHVGGGYWTDHSNGELELNETNEVTA